MKLAEPYRHLMPSLPAEVYANLKADIEANGLRVPILVDGEANILDGHHRYRACCELGIEPVIQIEGGLATDAEKRLRVWAINLNARHLSDASRREIARKQRALAIELIEKGRPKAEVARLVGCPRTTVIGWAAAACRVDTPAQTSNSTPQTPSSKPVLDPKPDNMSKPTRDDVAAKKAALRLIDEGASIREAARNVGRNPSTVRQWAESRDGDTRQERQERLAELRTKADAEVARLAENGLGTNAIAAQIGIPRGAVTEAKKRMGIGKAAARARNPLLNTIERVTAEAAVWRDIGDMVIAAAQAASPDQVAALLTELDRLASSVAFLKNRLKKEAASKERCNGSEIREASH